MIQSAGLNYYRYASKMLNSFYPTGPGSAPPFLPFNPTRLISAVTESSRQFAKSQATALVGLADNFGPLKSQASALDASSPSNVWQQRTVTSSVPAGLTGSADKGAKLATYKVNVTQIASAQQNTGSALSSSTATALSAGTQIFSLTAGGSSKSIAFNVSTGDTNQAVLSKMAQSINAAKAGVTAMVTTNASSATSQLVVTASSTGTASQFTLSDTAGSAVAFTGAGTVGKNATDAFYSVDGVSHKSGSNTVTLPDPKVTLTFAAPVSGADISVGHDEHAIATAVAKFADAYNSSISYINQNKQYISPQVANTLKKAYSDNADLLKKSGITAKPDGKLNVDETVLDASLKNNPAGLSQPLGGFTGLAKESGKLAERITSNQLYTYAKSSPYNFNYSGLAYGGQPGDTPPWLTGSLFNGLF